MKTRTIAISSFAALAALFAWTRPQSQFPTDLRDAMSDNFSASLAEMPEADGTDIPPARAESGNMSEESKLIEKIRPAIVKVMTGYGTGSGFIIDKSGILATNAHVVAPAEAGDQVDLRLEGASEPLKGTVLAVGSVKKRDIAFVQIESPRKDWKTLTLRPSLPIGAQVLTAGYPRGLPFSVSRGIISADPSPKEYFTAIQTDAAINPGNSGGPLLGMDGSVVGMNTYIITKGGGSEGLGFAIVSEEIRRSLQQYFKIGNIQTASLGAIITPEREVRDMLPGAAAEKAGILPKDVIVGFNGREINDTEVFLKQLRAFMPGDRVSVDVMRNKERIAVPVVLEAEREMPRMRLAIIEADQLPV